MKKYIIAFILLAATSWGATATISSYDFTNARICLSPSTVTVNCLDHPVNASGVVANITSHDFTPTLAYGTVIFSAIMVAKDSAGNRITSDPLKSTQSNTVVPVAPPSWCPRARTGSCHKLFSK